MPTVSWYLLREFLSASGLVFTGLLVIWLAADTLLHVDELAEPHALRDLAVRLLEVVPLGAPLACVLGVAWSLTRAVRFREVAAIRAGGIPLRRSLLPILAASLVIAATLALIEDRVIVPARAGLDDLRDADPDTPEPSRINGRWWHADGRTVLSAASYDEQRRRLRDVTVFRLDADGRVTERIDCAFALAVMDQTWEFRNARVVTFGQGTPLGLRHASVLRVDLGVTGAELVRAAPPPTSLTLHKLSDQIRDWNGAPEGLRALVAGFHERLARPLSVLVLVLIAIPFAIRDVERGDSLPRALLQGVVVSGVFFGLLASAQALARYPGLPAPLPVWGLIAGALLLGALRFRTIQE